jgi:hypothetical protein
MKGMNRTMMMPRRAGKTATAGKHEMLIRRAANHNLHVMTHHGKVMLGRKGRTG